MWCEVEVVETPGREPGGKECESLRSTQILEKERVVLCSGKQNLFTFFYGGSPMKVAIFRNKYNDEIIILAVKGNKNNPNSIDGFVSWFGDPKMSIRGDRNILDYNVSLCHIGAGASLVITPKIYFDTDGGDIKDISDWFYNE